ncbi:MAG: IclR family transcriptional regulator, regulon repressor [Chloroflexota bacterium]|jgi:DNA-binding IclR family transcriptional regulator|nr:IclR family transcriptional regulator, regulon repressor [Chloroflexota bacterium]
MAPSTAPLRAAQAVTSAPIAALDIAAPDGDAGERSLAGAQVVDRVVDILEAFPRLGPELGVSDVSRALGLKKATTHRLLASLLRRGMVAQDPISRRYRLGIKLWELGSLATSQVDWVDRVKPYLQHLTDVSGETTHLAVLNDGQVLYVDKVESSRSLRMPSQVGRRLPVHCTGVGKSLVAFLPDEVLKGIVARRGMAQMTAHTVTDLAILQQDLARARERGYAIDNEEIDEGLTCIAAPVRDHTSHVVAAISIAGPTSRFKPEVIPVRAAQVVEAANEMSLALGCPAEVLRPATV